MALAPASVVAVPTTFAPCAASATRDRPADAARGAGDQRDLAVELCHYASFSAAIACSSAARSASADALRAVARCA